MFSGLFFFLPALSPPLNPVYPPRILAINTYMVSSAPKPAGTSAIGGDCNDANAAVNPGANEQCNSIDDDCDGKTDDADDPVSGQKTYYADKDGDDHGSSATTKKTCSTTAPVGYVSSPADDCNDGNNTIYPGAAEGSNYDNTNQCFEADTYDNDCDAQVDEGTCKSDDDGDGVSEDRGDCNDNDASIAPGVKEVCDVAEVDEDCDGVSNTTVLFDQDGDGHLSSTECTGAGGRLSGDDCDDTDDEVYAGAVEYCDAIDQSCDGSIEDGFIDADSDGYYDAEQCADLFEDPGHIDLEPDCQDNDPSINPGAEELCDGIDNDCSGSADDGFDDQDGDSIGDCADPDRDGDGAEGELGDGRDCDDGDQSVHPGAPESCGDDLDQNCNGDPDDPTDVDGDGSLSCKNGEVFDCDDDDADTQPRGDELCDGLDNDCDGEVPENEGDSDRDGFRACEECDDSDDQSHPEADELCDGADNDCDGEIDEGSTGSWYPDEDRDGEGDEIAEASCAELEGYVDNQDDCNDLEATINSRAIEVCDGVDNDCDGRADAEQLAGELEVPGDGVDNDCDGSLIPTTESGAPPVMIASSLSDGCSTSPTRGPPGSGGWSLLALGALGFTRLRRRHRSPAMGGQ